MSSTIPVAELQDEYRVLTSACGLIDRSERGKLGLSGRDAVEFLDGQLTNELAHLRPGEGCYAAFLTHKGKMLGDLRVLAAGAEEPGAPRELLLDTERVSLQALFDMIRRYKLGFELELDKRTLEYGLFSLVGPAADELAGRAASEGTAPSDAAPGAAAPAPSLPDAEHAHRTASIGGRAVRLIRTREPAGVDVLFKAPDREIVWTALLAAGAQPVDEASGEILRVEHGRPRYGIDLDDTVIPQEAGLNGRAVSFTKGCYVGQETVARLYYKGKPNRHLRGLRLSAPGAHGDELRIGERTLGRLGSCVLSPVHGPIALALVRREAEPGTIVSAGERGVTATITELPFARAPSGVGISGSGECDQ